MTRGQTDTATLVRAAQAGDRGALDDLLGGHLPLLYDVVGRALGGHADVDDLVQETMVRIVRGLPALRDPTRFRSWAVAIAYRQIQRYARHRTTTRLRVQQTPVDPPDPGADFSERTVTELVLTGQRRELAEAARWLDDADRHLLALWWQEAAGELTRSELAAALGLTAPHAAVRIQRMRTRLEAARVVVRALRAQPRCDALSVGWTGTVDPLWRKRFIRHTRSCPDCGRLGRGLVSPEKLLPGLGSMPVPDSLANLDPGIVVTTPVSALNFKAAVLATAVLVAAGGGFTYAVHVTPWTADAAPPAGAWASSAALPLPGSPVPGGATAADLYVAPDGSDDNEGTLDRPFATLGKAASVVRAGQTIAMR
ncbi:RNA polymerase sigma factor [Virgisporangium ochraceum]|uniref:RNA polymerase sigma-70 region 2 domain-containing protein n=1 Tax=Virgisporangium ochraceum TaxID=65505 RepID=A0A8J4ECT8_9ACTN|nr:sigma-70 family RNA polymerase sigma factor [Virgisporangium ochraceum]GIJ69984.1 hypothetical protein Voc01_049010 [Virgisporangium ochraceum]